MKNLVAFLASQTDLPEEIAEAAAEMSAELAKDEAKAQANRTLYAEAHDVAMRFLGTEPMTVAEWFDACGDTLPESFSKSKMQYAVREYWADEIIKIEGKVNRYRKA